MNKYKCKDCGKESIINSSEKVLKFVCCKATVSEHLCPKPKSSAPFAFGQPELQKPTVTNAIPTEVGPNKLDTPQGGIKLPTATVEPTVESTK